MNISIPHSCYSSILEKYGCVNSRLLF